MLSPTQYAAGNASRGAIISKVSEEKQIGWGFATLYLPLLGEKAAELA
jgi:hypothetical protein